MSNAARSGHVGSMLSMADIVAVLYEKILNVDPKNPNMPYILFAKKWKYFLIDK